MMAGIQRWTLSVEALDVSLLIYDNAFLRS